MKREHVAERKIIAFDFYDGATEGFAQCLLDGSDCYFVLIAWDESQEDRLFGAVNVDRSVYMRVVSLFEKVQAVPNLPTWIPRWEFADSLDEREVSELIRLCRVRLNNEGSLLLTRQLGQKPRKTVRITREVAPEVARVLERGTPDDLATWLKHRLVL